jgi:4-hydroxy-tetrahydrodipicolinate reductase
MPEQTNVILAGLSNLEGKGKMALVTAENLLSDPRFNLLRVALSGPGLRLQKNSVDQVPRRDEVLRTGEVAINGEIFLLIHPDNHRKFLLYLKEKWGRLIALDFTNPKAVCRNAKLYCQLGIPFVMGTSPEKEDDKTALARMVEESHNIAVIAPNMCLQIAGFKAMVEYAAQKFPGLFAEFTLRIKESHQGGKKIISTTAENLLPFFEKIGTPLRADQIEMVRDKETQLAMGIPREFIDGHAWHTYELTSPGHDVLFSFTHNVNGRKAYALGTLEAAEFLGRQIRGGARGRVFSMKDVLQG